MNKPPRTVEGIELVIRGDSKTVVDWIIGKAKQKVSYRAVEIIQIELMVDRRALTFAKGAVTGRCTSSENITRRQYYGRILGPRGSAWNGMMSLRLTGPK